MSADTVVAEAQESVSRRGRWPRRPDRPVAELLAAVLRRDVFGVRLGVLLLILPMVATTLALQLTSRGMWNHPPDSRYYLPMMSKDMGHSWADSIKMNREISPAWNVSPWYFADNDPSWQMVRTRLLYPVLSIPFIWMWGLSGGSMAMPVIGSILFLWATARVLQRLYGPAVAVIVAGTFSLVQDVTGFAWAGTDTLAMGLAAVLVCNLPIERRIGKANLVWIGAMSVFLALTRQVGVLAPAMAGAGWLWLLVRERSWRNRWLGSLVVTAATTFVIQVATLMVVKADAAGVVGRGQSTYWGIIRQFVHYMKIVTQEAATYMWHEDRVLYALLIAAGISVLARFASDASAVFVGAVASTYVITAGVGFSSYMRYEMILFPAAAVAAGGLVQLAMGDRLPMALPAVRAASWGARTDTDTDGVSDGEAGDDAGVAETASVSTEPTVPARRFSLGVMDKLAATAGGRYLGLDQPRMERWKPQLILNSAVLVTVVAVSIPGSWQSTAAAPPSPSFAAAQGAESYAVDPILKPPAEVTLKAAFVRADDLARDVGILQDPFDWTHLFRYRPLEENQPGWTTREKDGTAVIHVNSLGQDRAGQEAFGNALTFHRTLKPDTVKILSRQVSKYGEDVVFTIQDVAGVEHRGKATTLYPIFWDKSPGFVTELVFDPS